MCGIAGYSFSLESTVDRTVGPRTARRHSRARGGLSGLRLPRRRLEGHGAQAARAQASSSTASRCPKPLHSSSCTSRDYTKGHPRVLATNHRIRHGAVVGIRNGTIANDDELFAAHRIARAEPQHDRRLRADLRACRAVSGTHRHALEGLVGSMATAWLDEGREELLLARGMGRPLWIGTSTRSSSSRRRAPRWTWSRRICPSSSASARCVRDPCSR